MVPRDLLSNFAALTAVIFRSETLAILSTVSCTLESIIIILCAPPNIQHAIFRESLIK